MQFPTGMKHHKVPPGATPNPPRGDEGLDKKPADRTPGEVRRAIEADAIEARKNLPRG